MKAYLEYFKEKGIRILNKLPDGWRYIENTNTEPKGYKWACNNKSMFSRDYEHALIKKGGENARGCKIEHEIAVRYNKFIKEL